MTLSLRKKVPEPAEDIGQQIEDAFNAIDGAENKPENVAELLK